MLKLLKYFLVIFISFMIGCWFSFSGSYKLWGSQLEVSLKQELKSNKNTRFKIPETNIEITKLRDGSGIIRIK